MKIIWEETDVRAGRLVQYRPDAVQMIVQSSVFAPDNFAMFNPGTGQVLTAYQNRSTIADYLNRMKMVPAIDDFICKTKP